MEKPRKRIHFQKHDSYDMGLLVLGRRVIPVWIIVSVTFLLVLVFLVGGGLEAASTDGQSFILLTSGLVLLVLGVVGLIIWGLVTLVKNIIKDIKKATNLVHGSSSEENWK